jgi:hypothetical protein
MERSSYFEKPLRRFFIKAGLDGTEDTVSPGILEHPNMLGQPFFGRERIVVNTSYEIPRGMFDRFVPCQRYTAL